MEIDNNYRYNYSMGDCMMRESRKLQLIILMALVCLVGTLSIAYAVLSTTLNINGHAEITAASWDIYFDNIQINSGSVEATKYPIVVNSRTIDFVVGLKEPGDYYKFTVDIVNNGTIDAMIDSVVKTPELTETQAKYIKYEIEYTDGNSINSKQLLSKGEARTMSVLVAYRSDVLSANIPTDGESLNLSFTMIYTQADESGTQIPESTPVVRVVNGDLNTVGSEICIGDECFYLIKNVGSSIMMLAKYNLHVGYYCSSSSSCVSYGEQATGKQASNMIAYPPNGSYPRNGAIAFSSTGYWASSVGSYPTYVYSSGSTLYNHIKKYVSYLESYNIKIEESRLINMKELEDLGCSVTSYNCKGAPSWVYSTTYWTGVASSRDYVWCVFSDRGLSGSYNYDNGGIGLRPIIKISVIYF